MAIQQQANNSDQVQQYDKSQRSRDDGSADQLKCLLIAIETDRFDARHMATLPLTRERQQHIVPNHFRYNSFRPQSQVFLRTWTAQSHSGHCFCHRRPLPCSAPEASAFSLVFCLIAFILFASA